MQLAVGNGICEHPGLSVEVDEKINRISGRAGEAKDMNTLVKSTERWFVIACSVQREGQLTHRVF
jgi:hypothetical protein